VAEAKTKAASADLLIVQGSDAGGHNRAKAALFSIVPAVVDALGGKLPILAAGRRRQRTWPRCRVRSGPTASQAIVNQRLARMTAP